MALKDNRVLPSRRLISSFRYAFQGLEHIVKYERNFQIHLTLAVIVIGSGFALQLNAIEWLFIVIAIFGVLALELVNLAIERVVDLVTSEIRPLAKQAKDLAAAAVLIYAILAVVIGIIIIGPKLLNIISR